MHEASNPASSNAPAAEQAPTVWLLELRPAGRTQASKDSAYAFPPVRTKQAKRASVM
jgi:hypothetical protein